MAGVKKNFAYQSIYQVTAIILPLLTSPYIARVLGAENIGIYSYTYAIAYYFMLVALLGISNHGNRTIAAARDNYDELCTAFSELMVVHCIFSTVAVVAYYVYVMLAVQEDKQYFLLQGFWVISAFFDISWFFFGLEKFKITVTQSILIKVFMTLCIFLFVRSVNDLWIYVLIMAGGTFLSQAVLWFFLGKYVRFKKVCWSGVKKQIKPMLVLFIPTVAVSLYKYMDKIMLGNMSTKLDVGFYENAERAINIPISIINSFGIVMLPKMSNMMAKGEQEKGKEYIGISMEIVMCLAIAMAFGMAGVANNFSVIFWGEEFILSGMIIQILTISIVFLAFANVLRTQYLIPQSENNVFVVSVCVGALVNLCINYFAIPSLASIGASIGTVLAEATVCIVQATAVRKELSIGIYIMKSVPFLVIGLIMYISVITVGDYINNRLIAFAAQLIVGVVVYCICCLVYFKRTNHPFWEKTMEGIKRWRQK